MSRTPFNYSYEEKDGDCKVLCDNCGRHFITNTCENIIVSIKILNLGWIIKKDPARGILDFCCKECKEEYERKSNNG